MIRRGVDVGQGSLGMRELSLGVLQPFEDRSLVNVLKTSQPWPSLSSSLGLNLPQDQSRMQRWKRRGPFQDGLLISCSKYSGGPERKQSMASHRLWSWALSPFLFPYV